MSTTSMSLPDRRVAVLARTRDFIELTKPRIAVLMLIVIAASAIVATWGQLDPWVVVHAMLGTLLVAGSASAGNQIVERFRDRYMPRTADRPLPAGRMLLWEAVVFAAGSLLLGTVWLWATVGWIPAAWGLLTWVLYVLIYTPLKPLTSANTAVGAVAGALPVFIGWTSTGAALDWRALALFLTLYLWQFPHFMAIAWLYREQYRRAGLKMLTVVDPAGRRAGVQAVLAATALIPVALVPALAGPGFGAAAYIVLATLLGLAQLALSVGFCVNRSERSARWLLRASLIYLPLILLMLMLFPWL
jgi:protoheme IX farnesyltransferase